MPFCKSKRKEIVRCEWCMEYKKKNENTTVIKIISIYCSLLSVSDEFLLAAG